MEIEEVDGSSPSPAPSSAAVFTVAVAVNGSKNSTQALKWALAKFVPEGRSSFRLIFVRPTVTMIPTPLGTFLPIDQVRDDIAAAYKKEMEWQADRIIVPYKKICAQKKVEAEAVIIEDDDVAAAIAGEIAKFRISKLVLGASSRKLFRRNFKMAAKISAAMPSFCTIYVIAKGKLSSVRSAGDHSSCNVSVASASSRSSGEARPSSVSSSFTTDSFTTKQSQEEEEVTPATPAREIYVKYTWEEIEAATSSFSGELMIGRGSNGAVYKANLHHTMAAVKVLHSLADGATRQLRREVSVLSAIRHPHLVLMLGACPERGCLVYEYMENGSLEDRLLRKGGSPALPWPDRCRIAWEVAAALAYLHDAKPEPIIHRDLKPANILLDHNLVSKIGDVGLSTVTAAATATAPVGTMCYIDPEYQRSGIVSPESDVYAFGIVVLQLLTGRAATGIAYAVETAMEEGRLAEVLDGDAGPWPFREAEELARVGLRCAEMRRKDRMDLAGEVLPALERLKTAASKFSGATASPPSHFICPILREVMDDPCVAADGYTYDRRAIERWLRMDAKSPMTNMKLESKLLIPNHPLRSAILEWRSSMATPPPPPPSS